MKQIIRKIIYLFLAANLVACATKIRTLKEDKSIQLEEQEGYLFLGVRTNSSLDKIIINGKTKIELSKEDLKSGSNYILSPLPAGKYYFSLVQVGWMKFDVDSENRELWTFEVKPGVVSYVGDLEIKKRWNSARFELVNNSSRALEFLEKTYKNIISETIVQYWGPGEDDFFDVVMEKQELEGASK